MSAAPRDVMAAAMRALMVPEDEMVESVSRAILAERERCAVRAETVDLYDGDRLKNSDPRKTCAAAILGDAQ